MKRLSYKMITCKEGKEHYGTPLSSPEEVCKAFFRIAGDALQEHMMVFLVDTKNRITHYEIISIGTLNQAVVHPRDAFRSAISHNAASVILAHNHPSGDSTPSAEDVEVTKRMADAGRVIGIPLLDHVIVCREYYSFKENGRI